MDMVPYDPQDKDRALVLDFFPLEITDDAMKTELTKRFFQVQGVVGRKKNAYRHVTLVVRRRSVFVSRTELVHVVQSIADSFCKPLNPTVFLNFCDNGDDDF